MGAKFLTIGFTIASLVAPACASTLTVRVTDQRQKPAANAVVEISPDSSVLASADRVTSEAIIDQRHEMFMPLVSVIRKGGHVVFTNNDTTMHQVYSFSEIKQFQFEIDQGQRSQPVVFDKAGVASIGCNIHDQMITYVYVASAPYAAISDESGRAVFSDIPPGSYHLRAWHPQIVPGVPLSSQALVVSQSNDTVSVLLTLLAQKPMTSMHMGQY